MYWYHIATVNLQPLATIELRSSIIYYLSPSVTHGWVCSFVLIIGGLLCNEPPRNLQFIRPLANRVGRWIHMINAIRLHWYRKTLTISAQSSPILSVLLLDTGFVEKIWPPRGGSRLSEKEDAAGSTCARFRKSYPHRIIKLAYCFNKVKNDSESKIIQFWPF